MSGALDTNQPASGAAKLGSLADRKAIAGNYLYVALVRAR